MTPASPTERLQVWFADGPGAARSSPTSAIVAAGYRSDTEMDVTVGWTVEQHPWLTDPVSSLRTVLAGYGLSQGVGSGNVTPVPMRLSAVASLLVRRPPHVAVITGVRRGDGFAFSRSVGWGDVLARTAGRVVVEVDAAGPDLGGPPIEGNIVATLERPDGTAPTVASRTADDVDLAIGATVADLLPQDPTLQFGPGGIGEGIARSLRQPVHIRSGLLTDAMAELHDRRLLASPALVSYTWGGEAVDRLARSGMLRLVSATLTHDLSALSGTPRFVGCNTALEVGLDGAVNVERVGSRTVAAVGGHADFCAGASRSVGGLSVVALRSTTRSGASTIVGRAHPVSTPRCDVDVVVTEHGVADLRGIGDAERAERMIAVAAPEHRSRLDAERTGAV